MLFQSLEVGQSGERNGESVGLSSAVFPTLFVPPKPFRQADNALETIVQYRCHEVSRAKHKLVVACSETLVREGILHRPDDGFPRLCGVVCTLHDIVCHAGM